VSTLRLQLAQYREVQCEGGEVPGGEPYAQLSTEAGTGGAEMKDLNNLRNKIIDIKSESERNVKMAQAYGFRA
jgi:hypothetical protein